MHLAIRLLILLGGLAAGQTVVTPSAAVPVATAENPVPAAAAADTLVHRVQAGDTLDALAIRYRAAAGWYGQADCLAAIRRANGLQDSDVLRIGQELRIPRHQPLPPPRAAHPVRDGAPLRGLYLPAPICGFEAVFARVDSFTLAGGNGVVIDAKDIDGGVSFRSAHPLAVWGKGRPAPVIGDLPGLVRRLHDRDLHVVGRLALFLDGELGRQRPDLALQDADGVPWTEHGCVWLDPRQPEVMAYLTTLAVELVRAGVDEVQIDYVRFPTNGWRGDWQGSLEATAAHRRQVITGVVAALHDTLAAHQVQLSADLFGIMAWGRTADLALTGQHVPSLAPHLDVICPMIYPSHFGPGFDGLENPGDQPRYIIAEGVRRFREQAGRDLPVRPWLQAFPWRVRDYGPDYVEAQIAASHGAGGAGWCLWNPAGRYDLALAGVAAAPTGPVPATGIGSAPAVARRAAAAEPVAVADAASSSPPPPHRDPTVAPGHLPTAPAAAPAHHEEAPVPAGPWPPRP